VFEEDPKRSRPSENIPVKAAMRPRTIFFESNIARTIMATVGSRQAARVNVMNVKRRIPDPE